MAVELKVPTAGESITEVQIGQWLKSEGDGVSQDEAVCEIETDKASMELPAPSEGVIKKILKKEGETAAVGEVIALIEEGAVPTKDDKRSESSRNEAARGEQRKSETPAGRAHAATEKQATAPEKHSAASRDAAASGAGEVDGPRVMPAAARMMAEHGLTPAQVEASGPGGRILKEDVQRAVEQGAAAPSGNGQHVAGGRQEEVVPMTMLRKRIAERLVDAQRTAAILTTFNEIDMSAILQLRKQRNDDFEKRYGIKLGFMSFFVKAAIDALKLIPAVNAEIRETSIVYKNYYDIGVAVSTDRGLVVPVVRNAELMSFAELEQKIAELATRARDRKLEVDELQGGTFTISNGGVFGSLMSTPILNPPQSGILGLHAIKERPVAIDGQVVIRPMMYVALSYDHRIVDGRESVTFLKRIKECIEDPTRMLIEV